jgi:hypothetical protein
MASIQFPSTPDDGDKFTPSNGIEYTYNQLNDSWTAAVGGGGGSFVPLGSWADINLLP